ncbi:TonB family protein [Steroidobacter sp.]|uniref:TonB family protein n=1 Tax=Steroidobacter sp. TaxID=1978227 RepID=UPI001A593D80|nr:TonB family protein [Steroidobacter sp.]MBL8269981.1 TonB family protein [Steroidobacter sp.]
MQSTKSEDFLSTVRTTAARPGQVVDVVVLTSDTSLLEALRSSAGSEHALWEAPSADAAVDYLVGGRCDVLIADLAALHGDVAALLERLQAQFPELIFMAIGRREDEGAVASLLSTGRIYRFLHKPISPGRASQFLNAATRRHNEQRDGQPIALQTVRTMARKRPYLGKVAAASAGVVAAVIAFALWQSRDQGLPATLQTTHVGDAPVEDTIKSKLGSAQIAYLSGRLLDPRGDNALEYYKAVLAMQPANADAKAGVQKVIDTLEQRVVKALEERNAARVVTAWTALQRAAPNHPQLDALRAQLLALSRTKPVQTVADNARPQAGTASPSATANIPSAAPRNSASVTNAPVSAPSRDTAGNALIAAEVAERELADAIARELADQEAASAAAASKAAAPAEQVAQVSDQPSPSPTEQAEQRPAQPGPALAEQVAAVASLRERGSLISPVGSNAFESVLALRASYPDAEEVRSEQQRLAFVLLDRSRTALAGNNVDEAATLIEHADKLIPGMQAVRTLQEQLSAAQAERDFTKNVAQAGSLKRVREVPPVYPRDAQRAGTEGWVQVEFTILPDGSTRDLQVRNSEPAEVFDKAALDSVSKWRFEPVRKNGTPVAQRAVLQVRFVLN